MGYAQGRITINNSVLQYSKIFKYSNIQIFKFDIKQV